MDPIERIHRNADTYLRGLFAEIRELPEVAEEWEEMPEDTREYFWNDWNMILIDNDFSALERWHRDGLLSREQEERYAQLKAALKDALPTLERFDIRPPHEILGNGQR